MEEGNPSLLLVRMRTVLTMQMKSPPLKTGTLCVHWHMGVTWIYSNRKRGQGKWSIIHVRYSLPLIFILYVFAFIVCITCVPGAHEGQNREFNPLEQQLHLVVSRHVGAGNHTWVFCRSSECSSRRSHLSSPCLIQPMYGVLKNQISENKNRKPGMVAHTF